MAVELQDHVKDWLPAFVLEILEQDETSRVAEHLSVCPICREELQHLQHVADELPLALAQSSPPAQVKDRLMVSIHKRSGVSTAPARQSSWQKIVALFGSRLPAMGLALIMVLALGNLLLWRQVNLTRLQSPAPMRVVALANTEASPQAVGTLVLDPQGKYGTLVVDNLAALSPSQQYQVWLTKGSARTSGGVFSVNPDGYASLEVLAPMPLGQYDSIGISIEPAGGSPAPTGSRVLGGDLTK